MEMTTTATVADGSKRQVGIWQPGEETGKQEKVEILGVNLR